MTPCPAVIASLSGRVYLVSVWDDLVSIGDGVRSAVEDVPSLIENVLTGDFHGAVTDGRNIVGDVTGVAQGMQNLGVSLGEVPRRYLGTAAKVADSKILAAAQLVIDGERALTGSGDPETGTGYKSSAAHLDDAVTTLVFSTPAEDQWDGAAADVYKKANDEHRRRVSAVQVADSTIAQVLSREADQVIRTRTMLDEASQYLYDFGLATAWMNFVPPLIPAKAAIDTAAAGAALGWTASSMEDLVTTSLQSAVDIWQAKRAYSDALGAIADEGNRADVPPETVGPCGTLTTQKSDLSRPPSRLSEPDNYEVPDIEREWGPPATPYGNLQNISTPPHTAATTAAPSSSPPAQAVPSRSLPSNPTAPAPANPNTPAAKVHSAVPAPTGAAPRPILHTPPGDAAPNDRGAEHAPIGPAPNNHRQTRTQ